MSYQKSKLFLGVKLDANLQLLLSKTPKPLKKLLITNDEKFLTELEHEDHPYLGKFIDQLTVTSSLVALQQHIMSLVKKLLPKAENITVELIPILELCQTKN